MKLRSLLELFIASVIVTFAVAIAVALVWKALVQTDIVVAQGFVAAFTGALFAFLFVRLGEALTKIHERLTKNRSAIIAVQHMLNSALSVISDNIHLCEEFNKTYNQSLNSGRITLFVNDFEPIEVRRELFLALLNLDFINDLHSYSVEARKLNHSMDTVFAMIRQANEARIAKNISDSNFMSAYQDNQRRFQELKEFLISLRERTIDLYAAGSVLVEDETVISKVARVISKSHYSKKQRAAMKEERARVEEQIERSAHESKERVDKILSQLNRES